MAGLTGDIERFLLEMLEETENGIIEIGRNDLATKFDCAPSQINYVLKTRFTPYKGYYIESRRGGSGYIKIISLEIDEKENLINIINRYIKDEITCDKARDIIDALVENDILNDQSRLLMMHAIDSKALKDINPNERNKVRASILKNMLLVFLR